MKPQGLLQSLGIRARVLILAVLPVASVVALLGYNLASSRLDDAERSLAERGALIARNLALASEFALFSRNVPLVVETLQRIANEPDVKWSAIWDAQREAIISRGGAPDQAQVLALIEAVRLGRPLPTGYHAAPVRVELVGFTDFIDEYAVPGTSRAGASPELLGLALIQIAPDTLVNRRAAIMRSSLLFALSGLMVSVLLAMLIGNSITEPMLGLLSAVRELQAGRLSARVRARAGGEIGNLERGVNQMAETLQASQQILQQRVAEATEALRSTVAELEMRNRELEQAREVALRAGQERTEFLARMSHEIRTPLNAVVGFTKLLQADGTSAANTEHVRTIQSAAEQLLRVINDILQFIRLDAGAEQLESLQFDVADVLEDAVAMLGPMANEKGLELILLLHSDLPQTLMGDPSRLSQIVVNLVNNAIKFTAEGQVMVEVRRRSGEGDDDQVEIAVSDTGIGLDAEEQGRIFSAFSQSDSSITRRFGGTGLGLSIARRLIELMHGEIGVESNKGEGSRFWVRLPCRGCAAPAPIERGGPLAGGRVLVYDANPFVRRSLRSLLTAWDVQVFNTGRWDKLLSMLADPVPGDGHFDAVIVGLSLAERHDADVEQAVGRLREHYPGYLLLLSGSEIWVPPAAVRAAGPVDWSTKPIRRATLRRLLGGTASETAAAAPPARARRLVGMQILMAEDNAFNRKLLRHLLEEEGASVDEAVSGMAAVSAATHGRYDVILMDLHMPEVDGTAAARAIRTALGQRTPPILALTADVFGRSDLHGAAGVFDDWLLKPIDAPQLIDRLAGRWRGGSATEAAPRRAPLPADLVARYRQEIQALVAELRRSLAGSDRAGTTRALHDLRGIVGVLGTPDAGALASRLTAARLDAGPAELDGLLEELLQRSRDPSTEG